MTHAPFCPQIRVFEDVEFSRRGSCSVLCILQVEESENEWSVPHCFTIYSAQRTVVVAAR